MRHFLERCRVYAGDDYGFSGMRGELLEQLQVGETQTNDLDPAEDLVRARLEDGLGFVNQQPVGSNQLNRALTFRNDGCVHGFPQRINFRIWSAVASTFSPRNRTSFSGVKSRPKVSKKTLRAGTDANAFLAQVLR